MSTSMCLWRTYLRGKPAARSTIRRCQRLARSVLNMATAATTPRRWSCGKHSSENSPIEDFTHRRFLPVLPDTEVSDARRILICTGKIGHELRMERQRRKDNSTAILFLEQLYPFPEQELADAIQQHASARDIVWVQ